MRPLLNNCHTLLNENFVIAGVFHYNYLLTDIKSKTNNESEKSLLLSVMDYSSTYIHERIHWNQFAGTSFGNLILLAKFAQGDFLHNACLYKGFQNLSRITQKVSIESNYTLNANNLSYNEVNAANVIQSIIDKELCIRLFCDGIGKLQKVPELNKVISTTLSDIHLNNDVFLGSKNSLGLDYLDAFYDFDKFKVPSYEGHIFSVKELLEGQARASEIIYLTCSCFKEIGYIDYDIYMSKYFKGYKEGSIYWSAFRYYLQLSKRNITDMNSSLEELTRFCAVVDLALSPKTILNSTLEDLSEQKFEDFYPTNRFVKACIASGVCEVKINSYDEDSIDYFSDSICNVLGWTTPKDLSKAYIDKYHDKISGFESEWKNDFRNFDQEPLSYYLHYIFCEFSKIRIKSPAYIHNFGIYHTGKYLMDNVEFLISGERYYMESPLILGATVETVATYLPKQKQFQWLVSRLVQTEILKGLFLGNVSYKKTIPFKMPTSLENAIANHFLKVHNVEVLK